MRLLQHVPARPPHDQNEVPLPRHSVRQHGVLEERGSARQEPVHTWDAKADRDIGLCPNRCDQQVITLKVTEQENIDYRLSIR